MELPFFKKKIQSYALLNRKYLYCSSSKRLLIFGLKLCMIIASRKRKFVLSLSVPNILAWILLSLLTFRQHLCRCLKTDDCWSVRCYRTRVCKLRIVLPMQVEWHALHINSYTIFFRWHKEFCSGFSNGQPRRIYNLFPLINIMKIFTGTCLPGKYAQVIASGK